MRVLPTLCSLSLILLDAVSAYDCGTTVLNQLPNIGLGLNSGILGKALKRTPVCCKEPGTLILGVDDNCRRIEREHPVTDEARRLADDSQRPS